MKLIYSAIIKLWRKKVKAWAGAMSFCVLSFLFLSFALFSCTDDVLDESSSSETQNYGDLAVVKFPGTMAIRITNTGSMSTRAGETTSPSDNVTFNDGLAAEYKLAPGNYHFAVIYETGKDAQTPLAVIPLTFEDADITGVETPDGENYIYDNITCYAESVVCTQDMKLKYGSLDNIKNLILKDNEAYVILNFDCSNIYKEGTTAPIDTKKSNAENLFAIKRSEFLSLPLADYKITINKIDYFTMSNSVYATNDIESKIIVDYTVNSSNVFPTREEAVNNDPAISVHVERLAAKYTVSFAETGYNSVNVATGLPEYNVSINRYTGITYTKDGYSINSDPKGATIRVVGYYVNNTEKSSYLVKKLTEGTKYFTPDRTLATTGSWTDPANFRSYWSEDPHYTLQAEQTDHYKRAKGYPHQFRLALERDSILNLHGVSISNDGETIIRTGYEYDEEPQVTVERNIWGIGENGNWEVKEKKEVTYYKDLGTPDNTSLNEECVLKYWSFNEMMSEYNKLKEKETKPFYSLENTYYDPGMTMNGIAGSSWVWEWRKASYSAATNFTLLCEMKLDEDAGSGETLSTFYRGQNNIYYFDENDLLASKLEIFNNVILNQGNAGINILHAYFASHGFLNTGEDDFHGNTSLEKVAWNRESFLWIGEVEDDGTEVGPSREMTASDLRLIPAEIEGGDGQCLIAPKMMGPNWRFFLAPIYTNASGQPINDRGELVNIENGDQYYRDRTKSVEISFNHLVALIHKGIGPIDVFTNGKMYYSIPIPHRVQSLNNMSGVNPDWKTLANIGVVRNNWYNITVSNITGVGTPVHDVTQPIVPVMETVRSYINANIQVYGWHTLEQSGIPMQ